MGKHSRYREMEASMTRILIAETVVFVLYMIFAGFGITSLKVITAIIAILGSLLCVGFLYFAGEFLKRRSRWLFAGFGGIFLLTVVSLILRFPGPLK